MLRHICSGSRLRTVVIVVSGLLALAGWGGAAWSWLDHGFAAGINPGFILALTVGCCFTIVFAQALITPGHAKVYGVGFIDGRAAQRELEESGRRRHLSAV